MPDPIEFTAFLKLKNDNDRLAAENEALKGGGGGGTLPPMEGRVTALETHMQYVQRDLGEIRGDLKTVIDRLDHLPTKSDLNTWRWQWIAAGLAIIALTVGGITGGLALIARFAG